MTALLIGAYGSDMDGGARGVGSARSDLDGAVTISGDVLESASPSGLAARGDRLVATLDGEPLAAFDDLVLADDGTLTQAIALPRAGAFLRQIDVGLWRSSDPEDGEPYRSVRLSLRGVP